MYKDSSTKDYQKDKKRVSKKKLVKKVGTYPKTKKNKSKNMVANYINTFTRMKNKD